MKNTLKEIDFSPYFQSLNSSINLRPNLEIKSLLYRKKFGCRVLYDKSVQSLAGDGP